jgi:hypothetical protein
MRHQAIGVFCEESLVFQPLIKPNPIADFLMSRQSTVLGCETKSPQDRMSRRQQGKQAVHLTGKQDLQV